MRNYMSLLQKSKSTKRFDQNAAVFQFLLRKDLVLTVIENIDLFLHVLPRELPLARHLLQCPNSIHLLI
jgi:hypothetical protein